MGLRIDNDERQGGDVRRRVLLALLPLVLLAGCGGVGSSTPAAQCTATVPGAALVTLTPKQAGHAATIAAVGLRDGLPNHAVTVALATALQESALRNLDYGDRDSLGLFQQRPSQGWGTPAQVQDPAHAAGSFYSHLRRVPGWPTLPVTEAAQTVQRSAFPKAYGDHEDDARVLARALTGEVPAAFACSALPTGEGLKADRLRADARAELGRDWMRPTGAAATWASASWLVAHALEDGVTSVSAAGLRWTASSGAWAADPAAGPGVSYR